MPTGGLTKRVLSLARRGPARLAADVCTVLGYADVSQACGRLDQDVVELIKHQNSEKSVGRKALYATESGLYSLIPGGTSNCASSARSWGFRTTS